MASFQEKSIPKTLFYATSTGGPLICRYFWATKTRGKSWQLVGAMAMLDLPDVLDAFCLPTNEVVISVALAMCTYVNVRTGENWQ